MLAPTERTNHVHAALSYAQCQGVGQHAAVAHHAAAQPVLPPPQPDQALPAPAILAGTAAVPIAGCDAPRIRHLGLLLRWVHARRRALREGAARHPPCDHARLLRTGHVGRKGQVPKQGQLGPAHQGHSLTRGRFVSPISGQSLTTRDCPLPFLY